tara:strand:- start:634 stop:843 length:210 start_codon:yes stop_codon:yes gene_type:complete
MAEEIEVGVFQQRIKIKELEESNDVHNRLKPQSIFLEKNSQLTELENVKIVWSNFRKCYKLIQDESEQN